MTKVHDYPTLCDRIRASTLLPLDRGVPSFLPQPELRQKLFSARRFVLDDKMSAMLGDLSHSAFSAKTVEARYRAIEAMRTGARLPHKLTWVEYSLRELFRRVRSTYPTRSNDGGPLSKISAMPLQEGWLLEQHPQIETAFRATVYVGDDKADYKGFDTWEFPFAYCWTTDDSPMPWKQGAEVLSLSSGKLAPLIVGLDGYTSPHVSVETMPDAYSQKDHDTLAKLLIEWGGVVRRMWALLSTINDLPVEFREVKPSRGYMMRRNYHRFMEHKIITLTVPQTEYQKVARTAVARARRRAHQVRGHWRKDWRHPGSRVWIREHQRGDASLGFVTHDYQVKAAEDAQQ